MEAYTKSSKEILKEFNVNVSKGLDDQGVINSRKQYGSNQIDIRKKKTLLARVCENLKEPMVIILMIAAAITIGVNVLKGINGYETEFIECVGIIVAIALTIVITLVMEGKSEKAFELLNQMKEDIQVKVIRNGTVQLISQSEVVVGDILFVATGDKLVADGRLIEVNELQVDESMLTGESHTISKCVEGCDEDTVVAERVNMVYSGSFVTAGNGKIVVTDVGSHTEFGKISEGLLEGTETQTPLQEKLQTLSKKIALFGASIAIVAFILQILTMRGNYSLEGVSEAFIASIVLIVAAVPEGLSTIVAASLAINVIKLAKQNTLVKKMVACETIGSTNIICSDKTGTLTKNKMTVIAVETTKQDLHNSIDGYLIKNICINSTADIEINSNKEIRFIGNPTESALLTFVYHKGIDYKQLRQENEIMYVQPFSSDQKKMTTIIKDKNQMLVLIKGSPEKILELCDLGEQQKEILREKMESYQKQACRLIAFCHKLIGLEELMRGSIETRIIEDQNIKNEEREVNPPYERDMSYDGFVAITDPLREETYPAIQKCKEAGIEIKMLTGDNKVTAMAIAKDLDIIEEEDLVVEAKELEKLADETFEKVLPHVRVIARSTPLIKMRVVNKLKAMGNVVAVTGDGINDSPALKHADIGIAMGISGTEVSKEASDMILLDDSFSTIIKAIEWGRGLYENFQRFIQFQLTVNVASVIVVLGALLLGYKAPFTPLQLLWINIIMDGPPALSLGLEPIQNEIMRRRPVSRNAGIVSRPMLKSILRNGTIIASICLVQNSMNFLEGLPNESGTVLFTLFMVCQLFNAINSRKLKSESIREYGFKNKKMIGVLVLTFVLQIVITQFGGKLFNTVPLGIIMWLKIVAIGICILIVDEGVRYLERKRKQ